LKNLDKYYPGYDGQGYEISGFVFWQGHKDQNPAHASRYEQNLVRLIKAWRAEFNAPKAPFVIATIGFGGWEMAGPHLTVANAQLAVSGEKGNYPEFAGNVSTVETRGFWRDSSVSPRSQGYHYNRNAETYMLVGDALGRAMVRLLGGKAEAPPGDRAQ
jgi:alpha-galactosidase